MLTLPSSFGSPGASLERPISRLSRANIIFKARPFLDRRACKCLWSVNLTNAERRSRSTHGAKKLGATCRAPEQVITSR